MGVGLDSSLDEAVREIARLLAAAYRRHARVQQVGMPNPPLPSTEALDNTGELSPHELTLTRWRKESPRS
jgi:hypothetical protein